MEQVINSEKAPIKLWLPQLDNDTLQQARNLANLPFIHHHIAIMPDAHMGYGMPIGGVAATKDTIIPNAVGVDIGCGVQAVQTDLQEVSPKSLKRLMSGVRRDIPLGFKHHKKGQSTDRMPRLPKNIALNDLPIVSGEYKSARNQVGTLGGGNHFIEIQQDQDHYIWLMIHSGSRNIGYKVANHYNKLAIDINQREKHPVPPKWQLASLNLYSEEGQLYFSEMQYCVDFAKANRSLMMDRLMDIIQEHLAPVKFTDRLDIAHNYAALEHHFGEKVVVHRKGATRAAKGERGIIPGSQGSSSYIVEGKGNEQSFCSCSHGAGRKLGRKQAQRTLDLQEEIKYLESQNIIHAIRTKRDLEEAAGAYKDIDQVMALQEDLITPLKTLRPLAVVKG